MFKRTIGVIVGVLLFVAVGHATLWQRENGLIYDDVNNITWFQDMNYALTSGYVLTLRHANKLGVMTWKQAVEFVDNLEYGGFSDWRLPVSDESKGFVADGEMGSMYYVSMNKTDPFTFTDGYGETVTFLNPQRYGYWTSTQSDFNRRYKWTFNFSTGASDYVERRAVRCVWPVRDGDVETYNYLKFGADIVYFGSDEVVF